MAWCNVAGGFSRARHHCEPQNVPNIGEVPPDTVLLAHRVDDAPSVPVLTDVELDSLEPSDVLVS